MPKYFENATSFKDDKVIIKDENFHHLVNVLRQKIGFKIEVTNIEDNLTYNCEIIQINKDCLVAKILEKIKSKEEKIKYYIFQGIPKKDKMEYIIEKTTELGASYVIPVKFSNCVGKIDGKEEKKIAKWNNIAKAASKQSRRDCILKVLNQVSINKPDFNDLINSLDYVFVLNENEQEQNLRQNILKIKENKNIDDLKIGIIIGPEGGITQNEIDILKQNGAKSISLGRRILRTETASVVILSILNYEFEGF